MASCKVVPVDGVVGLSVETVLLAPTALVLIIIWERAGDMTFGHGNTNSDLLIALSGIVTTLPLICFAQAVRRVSLVTIGVLQYLSPTLQLLVAVLLYDEKFNFIHQISFGLIWTGLAIYVLDVIRTAAKRRSMPATDPIPEPLDGGFPVTDSGLTDIRPTPVLLEPVKDCLGLLAELSIFGTCAGAAAGRVRHQCSKPPGFTATTSGANILRSPWR